MKQCMSVTGIKRILANDAVCAKAAVDGCG